MRYENPQPEEGINYTKEHPLKEFAQLLIGVTVFIAVAIFVLNMMTGHLAQYIPFDYEKKMVGEIEFMDYQKSPQQVGLQILADQLSSNMGLPKSMTITVHYDESDVVNALATLGGNLIFFQGLVEQIKSEEELAAVMAHEIAHIKLRHPIIAAGKGFTLAALVSFVGGASGSAAGEWLIGSSANLSMLQFSRTQERAADKLAAQVLFETYGHIGGADKLFKRFSELEAEHFDDSIGVELLRSHPYSENRWQELKQLASTRGWPTSGSATPWQSSIESD